MDKFIYKKAAGVTVLSASMTEFSYKRHAHEEYAIGLTLSGIQQYHLHGTLQSSHQNGIICFSPEQAHDGFAGDKNGINYVMLYIPTKLFAEVLGRERILSFTKPVIYDSKLAQNILQLSANILNNDNNAPLYEQLIELVDRLALADVQTAGRSTRRDISIEKAIEMLRSSFTVLKLDDICDEIGMSKFHFIRSFKKEVGISPYQYFLSCKVEHAKQLLDAGEDIYTVILTCGFFDLPHLNRHFKAVYGVTTFEYQRYIKQTGCVQWNLAQRLP